MKTHFEVLDGLRGTAALCVFMFHIWEMLVPDLAHNPMPHTFLAVDFFFALSGFVLGHAYDARLSPQADGQARLSIPGFFARRLIRLHPMVLAAMVIGIAGYLLDPFVGDAQRVGEKLSLAMLVLCFAGSLLLLPTPTLPNYFGETHSVNGPSWTLFQEYLANLLYGLFGHRLRRNAHLLLCLVSSAALLATAWHFGDLGYGWGWAHFWVAPVRLACPFLLGLLVYRSQLKLALPQPYLVLSGVLVAVFAAPRMGAWNGVFEALCVIVVFPLVLAAGWSVTTATGWTSPICRASGALSYPLYIIHYPFIYLFAHWNWSTHPGQDKLAAVAIVMYLGGALLAWCLLRWYDQPLRAWLNKKTIEHPRRPVAPALPESEKIPT
jgi:peptidoglycan/LPS O-acetylase OafA/YrhL